MNRAATALAILVILASGCAQRRPAPPVPPRPEHPPAAAVPAAATSLARSLGFDAAAIGEFEAGGIVTRLAAPEHETELALAGAMIVDVGVEDLTRFLEGGGALRADPQAEATGEPAEAEAADSGSDQAYAQARFTAGEAAEARRFLFARPGTFFNLSASELQQLAAARAGLPGEPPAPDERVLGLANAEIRRILGSRLAAYRARGHEGIEPYARTGDLATTPASQLATESPAAAAVGGDTDAAPTFPLTATQGTPQRLIWSKGTVESRPQFELIHIWLVPLPGRTVYRERHFYALHSYNAIDITMAMFPMDGHTAVFYTNRTWTDEITGFGGALRRGIAQQRFETEIADYLARLRAAAEADRASATPATAPSGRAGPPLARAAGLGTLGERR